jgi:hypothetical protein
MQPLSNNLLIGVILILGVFMVFESLSISKKIKSDCDSNKLRNSNRGVLMIGTTFVVLAVSFAICNYSSPSGTTTGTKEANFVVGFALILGIVLISLGSIISSESKKTDCSASASSIYTVGIVMFLSCSIYIGNEVYNVKGRSKVASM